MVQKDLPVICKIFRVERLDAGQLIGPVQEFIFPLSHLVERKELNAGDAHLAVDYESLLRLGLKGYEARTRQLKADLDLTEPESIDKYQFYKAVLIVIDAVRGFAARFADLARKKAETADGKDAVNRLSFLVLKSIGQTRLPQPNLTVRYHRNISQAFMDEAIEVLKLGTGMPAFNNDEVIIPSFIEKGVKKEDAYCYSAIGCVETAVPGKWGYRCTGMSYLNFPRILLMVMNNGIDVTSGKRFVKDYGNFRDMESFDELMKAWDGAIRELTRASVIVENAIDLASEREVPDILCSCLTQDCLGRGKTIKEGGAVYDFISGLQVGIANMADSLSAIKKLVYEEKKISRDELMNALATDFAGPEGERIRQMLINDAPKYGNDDDYADRLVVDAYASYLDEMKKYKNTRFGRGPIGGIRYGGTSSISANVGQGFGTMATPDGRHAKEPLAEGCSPAHSMDKHGPTAVFKSVSKLPTHEITGGVLLNQKVTPAMLSTQENTKKLEFIVRTFFNRLEGYHVQYNVVDKATLLDAQAHPEKHKDLIVRVAGYSAFFNVLSKATQDDIIGRTEQTL